MCANSRENTTYYYHNILEGDWTLPGNQFSVDLPYISLQELEIFAEKLGVGVPQIFLGMLATYFSVVYDKEQVSIGIPSHNRNNFAQKQMIGVFANVTPLILSIDKSHDFQHLVSSIARQQKANFRHQRFPIGQIFQSLELSGKNHSIFDINFNYMRTESTLNFENNNADIIHLSHNHQQTPLTVTIWDGGKDSIKIHLEYNLNYFCETEIEQLARRFTFLLKTLPLNA